YLQNQNDYNIRVISFGYGSDKYVGMSMLGTCRVLTTLEIEIIQTLIIQLISAGSHFSDRPSLLMESQNSHFLGHIEFQDGWALLSTEEALT
ncbi:MAG: hypothetical protein LH647_18090, partial [Leptolyngbyaceae cyanobacterium CAN_BIN12]|nr:hypothetical protein [Leptolyngbyaceae cyanobacterium CAN_BIN12]